MCIRIATTPDNDGRGSWQRVVILAFSALIHALTKRQIVVVITFEQTKQSCDKDVCNNVVSVFSIHIALTIHGEGVIYVAQNKIISNDSHPICWFVSPAERILEILEFH